MLIAPSPLVTDMRGTVANVTFQQTLAGLQARYTNAVVKPTSVEQFLVMASLASISQTWKSPPMFSFRAGWILLAHNYPYRDVFGVPHVLTGSAMFAKLNQNLNTIGVSLILQAPTSLATGSPLALTITANIGPPATLTISGNQAPGAAEAVVIKTTKQLSPGVVSLGTTSTILQVFPAGTNPPWDVSAKYNAKYRTITAGTLVYVTVYYVNNTTGYAGTPVISSFNW